MTFILLLLHCYYHLKKVHRVGSSLIMKVTLAYYGFTVLLYRWANILLCHDDDNKQQY